MFVKYLIVFICVFYATGIGAVDKFIVKGIKVEGIQRTEAGTVFSYLPIKVGDTLDSAQATAAIKALYATGFFKDVKLKSEGGVLIVQVEERPAIASIVINGAEEFEADKLKEGLKQAGLSESRIFNRSLLDRAEQELKRQYISLGKYAVKITTTATPLKRNRVGISFDIDEGKTARIKQIGFVGNDTFDDDTLRKLFVLSTPSLFTWFTKNDQYSKQKLSADLEALRSYYLDRGYLEFSIDSTQVSITPSMRDIYITINISEGSQFTVLDIKLAGDYVVPEKELNKLILFEPGAIFARKELTESVKLITDRLGDDGYAFANVTASPELDKENQRASFTFFIDPGPRVYIRRINISGNDRTRDEVIRREFRQMEGGWYSTQQINTSRQRVDRLAFFSSVNVETPLVPDAPDQIDINVTVEEKPTGAIMFGAGFSDQQGLILNASVSQNNIFGTGNFLSININTGRINRVIAASFTNPYFTVDGISLGVDAFRRTLNTSQLSRVSEFKTTTTGATLRFGIPIAENDIISFGLGAERTSLNIDPITSLQSTIDFVNESGKITNNFPLTVSWARDQRDSAIYTTSGTTHRLFGEVSVPGGDLNYYKVSYAQKTFFPLTDIFTLLINTELGIGGGYGGKTLPFFKNFFAGGNNSVRGFRLNSLGPREPTRILDGNGNVIDGEEFARGGRKRVVGNLELLFPVPFVGDDKSLRLSMFLDGGSVFGRKIKLDDMRYSAGFSLSWTSPLGPLKVSIAKPISKKEGDNLQVFQFQFGQRF